MYNAYSLSQPVTRHYYNDGSEYDSWHLPLMPDIEELSQLFSYNDLIAISTGRCARVSYLTHDGVRDPMKDIELHDRLLTSGHWSPFEHCAMPMNPFYHDESSRSGNFRGWQQYRKRFTQENQSKPFTRI